MCSIFRYWWVWLNYDHINYCPPAANLTWCLCWFFFFCFAVAHISSSIVHHPYFSILKYFSSPLRYFVSKGIILKHKHFELDSLCHWGWTWGQGQSVFLHVFDCVHLYNIFSFSFSEIYLRTNFSFFHKKTHRSMLQRFLVLVIILGWLVHRMLISLDHCLRNSSEKVCLL